MDDERKRHVAAGYDDIVERYPAWVAAVDGDPRDRMLEAFAARLPDGSRVVDEVIEMNEPEGPVSFLWVIAQTP